MQCFRTDLSINDDVIVRRADGKLRTGKITQLKYLNWDCKGRIECTRSECSFDDKGNLILPKGSPLVSGVSTAEIFIKILRTRGWIPLKSKQKTFRLVLAQKNQSQIAYIFVRRNGVDLRLYKATGNEEIKPYSFFQSSSLETALVRHSLAHTTFNLYEGILRFATDFINNESSLERYFVPQGAADKRTEKLKFVAKQSRGEDGIEVIGEYADDMLYGYHCK